MRIHHLNRGTMCPRSTRLLDPHDLELAQAVVAAAAA
jgi:hypothetical protein